MSAVASLDVRPPELALLLEILRAHVADREVWAFGSRVTGRAKPYSDLDLAVVGDAPLPIDRVAALNEALAESDLPWKVDVVDWARIGDRFRRIVERDRIVVQAAGRG